MNVVLSILEHDLLFQFKPDDKVSDVSSCVEELLGSTKFEFQCKNGTIPDRNAPISDFATASNLVEFEISLNGCALEIKVRLPSGRVQKKMYPDSKVNEQLIRGIASDLHTEPDRVMLFYKGQRFCPIPLRPWYTDDDEIVVVVKETRPLLVFEKPEGDKFECYCGRDEDWKDLVVERVGVEKFIIKSNGVVVTDPFGVDGEIQVEKLEESPPNEADYMNVTAGTRTVVYKGKKRDDIRETLTFKKLKEELNVRSERRLFYRTIEIPEDYEVRIVPATVVLELVDSGRNRKDLDRIEVKYTDNASPVEKVVLNVTVKTTAKELASFLGEDCRLSYENRVLSDDTLVAGLESVKLESKHSYQIKPPLPDGTERLEVYSTVAGELKRAIAMKCRKPIECINLPGHHDTLDPNVTYTWEEQTNVNIDVRVVLPHLFLVTVSVRPKDKVTTLKTTICEKFMNQGMHTTDFKLFVENQAMVENDEIWNWCYEREDEYPVIVKMERALPLKTVEFGIAGLSKSGNLESTTITGHFSELWTFQQVLQWISSKAEKDFIYPLEYGYKVEQGTKRVSKKFLWSQLEENSDARFKLRMHTAHMNMYKAPKEANRTEVIQICPLNYSMSKADLTGTEPLVVQVFRYVQNKLKGIKGFKYLHASDFTILTDQTRKPPSLLFKSYCLYKGRLTRVTNWTKAPSGPDHYIMYDEDTIEIPRRVPVDMVLLRYSESCSVELSINYPNCKLFDKARAQARRCYRCYTLIQAKNNIIRDWNLEVESLDDITFKKKGTDDEIIDLCPLAPFYLPEERTKMEVDLCVKLSYPVKRFDADPQTKYDVDKTLLDTLKWDKCCIEGWVLDCKEWKFGDLVSLPYRFESIYKVGKSDGRATVDESHVVEVTFQWRQKTTDHKKKFEFTDDARLDHVLLCGLDFVESFLSAKVLAGFSGVLPPEWFALIYVTEDKKVITIPDMTKTLGDFRKKNSLQGPLEFVIVEVPNRMLLFDPEDAAPNTDAKLSAATQPTVVFDEASAQVSASKFNGEPVVGKTLREDGRGCNPNRCVEFFREVGLLHRFWRHPCVVETVGYFIYRDRARTATIYYMMTRLLKELSLEKATESGSQRNDFCPTSRSIVLFGCAETYADLQDLGFVLRDIKPANILLKFQNIKEDSDSANPQVLPVLCPVTCDYGLVKIDARNEGNSVLPTPMYQDARVAVGQRFELEYDIYPFIQVIKRTYGINDKENDMDSKDDDMSKFKQRIRELTKSTSITMRGLADTLKQKEYHYPGTREEIFRGYVKYLDEEKRRFRENEIMNGRNLEDLKNGTGLLEEETWKRIDDTRVNVSHYELPSHLRLPSAS